MSVWVCKCFVTWVCGYVNVLLCGCVATYQYKEGIGDSIMYRFRSDCSYSLVPANAGGPPLLPPPCFSCPGQRNKASTCARDRRALQQLALNVHVIHSDLTWPDNIMACPKFDRRLSSSRVYYRLVLPTVPQRFIFLMVLSLNVMFLKLYIYI